MTLFNNYNKRELPKSISEEARLVYEAYVNYGKKRNAKRFFHSKNCSIASIETMHISECISASGSFCYVKQHGTQPTVKDLSRYLTRSEILVGLAELDGILNEDNELISEINNHNFKECEKK